MSKSWIVEVQSGGRIILPKELMKQMGWKVGDVLLVRVMSDGSILLMKEKSDDDVTELGSGHGA